MHWVLPNGLAGAILSIITGKKLLISLHGSDMYLAKKNRLFRLITKFIFSNATKVTACSKDLYFDAIRLGAKNKVNLIEWGVDPNIFYPSESDYFERKLSIKKNKNDIYILALGRLVYKKGFDKLILACRQYIKNK